MEVPKVDMRPALTRVLRLSDSIAIITGIIIGSGIFRTPTDVARELHSAGPILAVWFLGGLTTLFGSMTYAELASAWPRTGGLYVYLRECFGSLVSFLYGWGQLLVVRPAGVAAIAVVFAQYVAYFIPVSHTGVQLIAVTGILTVSIINYMGVRLTSVIQNILTSVKVLALILIIVVGLFFTGSGAVQVGSFFPKAVGGSFFSALGAALMLIYWTYDGWNEITFVAGEIRDPGRTIQKALLVSSFLILLLYVLVNLSYLHVLSVAGVAASEHVATDAMVRVLGPAGGGLIAAMVIIATFSALNATTLTGSRIFFAMAVDGNFFSWAKRIDPKYRTPSTAIALQALLAVPLVITWKFEELAVYYVFVSLIFHILASAAVFRLRRMGDVARDTYKTWGYPYTPMVFLLVAVAMLLNSFIASPTQAIVGTLIMLGGVPCYFIWNKLRAGPNKSL